LLADVETYREIEEKALPIDTIDKKIKEIIQDEKDFFQNYELNYLNYNWKEKCSIPNFYIIPKVHKIPWQGRPIVASHSWITAPISKFVDYLLTNVVRKFCYTVVKDSKDVINKLEQLKADFDQKEITIITADVTSLYTMIPHNDGIKSVNNLLKEIGNPFTGIVTQFLDIIMNNNFFKYNNKIYHQIKGTAMGTACAPAYANIFLFMLERDVLDQYKQSIWCYWRFLDDVFSVYKGKIDINHPFITS
jgi:hypothetical protein